MQRTQDWKLCKSRDDMKLKSDTIWTIVLLMRWFCQIRSSQPTTWQHSWFKNRHREKYCDARRIISDTQWVNLWWYYETVIWRGAKFLLGVMIQRNSTISAREVTTQLKQESTLLEKPRCYYRIRDEPVMLWDWYPINEGQCSRWVE